jgi:hypothetical protein
MYADCQTFFPLWPSIHNNYADWPCKTYICPKIYPENHLITLGTNNIVDICLNFGYTLVGKYKNYIQIKYGTRCNAPLTCTRRKAHPAGLAVVIYRQNNSSLGAKVKNLQGDARAQTNWKRPIFHGNWQHLYRSCWETKGLMENTTGTYLM